ncbi:MAG: homoserine O-acetyltransferase [Chitinophagaceae bacterium]
MLHQYISTHPFILESGSILPRIEIAFHTYGTLNEAKSNVVWICHALTANADAADWWPGMVGSDGVIDTGKYFVVCANILGSCYGTTGPLSIHPQKAEPYFHSFPNITIKDMVAAHILLRQHLGIDSIQLLMGGSMGGYQVLEWALTEPDLIKSNFLIATSAAESAWGIAIHTAQRLAIEADSSWREDNLSAGAKGLKAARAIGMLTYRNYAMYEQQQKDPDTSKTGNFRAESYINYQGEKLVNRFNAYSYWFLSKAMDSHNIARKRSGDLIEELKNIKQHTLILAISSDILCPPAEQKLIAKHVPNSTFYEIDSAFGHDGFLIEIKMIGEKLITWFENL